MRQSTVIDFPYTETAWLLRSCNNRTYLYLYVRYGTALRPHSMLQRGAKQLKLAQKARLRLALCLGLSSRAGHKSDDVWLVKCAAFST